MISPARILFPLDTVLKNLYFIPHRHPSLDPISLVTVTWRRGRALGLRPNPQTWLGRHLGIFHAIFRLDIPDEPPTVVAISVSDIASKQLRYLDAKSTQYCWQLVVIYICNKSTNKDTSQHASTNNITGIHYNNLRPQMGAPLCVLLHSLKVRSDKSTESSNQWVLIHFIWVLKGVVPQY